ncbi:GntR family transcriptional regulator [Desulfotomaculum arcticum]|uniref:GntR family transcriptional regulator n=1 Tax=Desulfotruncus arcticus DSM 17038 TaxID=1121424 RepID=A0A1I2SN86_9FIRM|nr:GntR family transcriptional regulator [Desulfotruncus arcticus]SFG54214.1 GntR family transcriptional regulator [Desulfotomaculum arcticum] [Desulfotruncus arcticus DSM 17038]
MDNKLISQLKIDKNSVIPIYYQIAKMFEGYIYEGKLKPGEVLPPEHEIAENFGISRMTVRRAISELINLGLVFTQKGKGTFVSEPKLNDVTFELGDFYEETSKKGMTPSSTLLGVRIVRANKTLSEKLAVPLGTSCLYFSLVLAADNEPLVYEKKYVKYTKQKPILEVELKDPSLSSLAVTHGSHFPTTSKRVLHASIATKEETSVLEVKENTPVFVVEQTVYDAEKKPVGWGKSVYRGDRYKLTSYIGWSANNIK